MKAAGNLKRPLIPLVIGWVKTAWEGIPEQMVHKSFLKCVISNKMEQKMMPFMKIFLATAVPTFSWMTRMILILRDFNHIYGQKTL